MDKHVIFMISTRIAPADFEEFKGVVERLVADSSSEKGTLTYEYCASEDHSRITIFERYLDAAAATSHVTDTYAPYAEDFDRLTQNETFFVQGEVTPELERCLQGAPVIYLTPLVGFDRY